MARQRVPEGPPPAPAVQKLRIRYAKRGRLRFSSTRDFSRAIERALRRAGVPMALSAGFHPHQKISYANGAPTGAASEAEFFEISVTKRCDPDAVRAALDEALPDGLDILEVVEAAPGALADRLQGSVWRIELRGLSAEQVQLAVTAFLAATEVEVSRVFKTGRKTFDVRGAVTDLTLISAGGIVASTEASTDPCAILRVVVRHTTPAVRPDDVLTALRVVADLVPATSPLVTRLAQGPLTPATAEVADPLAADKETVGS